MAGLLSRRLALDDSIRLLAPERVSKCTSAIVKRTRVRVPRPCRHAIRYCTRDEASRNTPAPPSPWVAWLVQRTTKGFEPDLLQKLRHLGRRQAVKRDLVALFRRIAA